MAAPKASKPTREACLEHGREPNDNCEQCQGIKEVLEKILVRIENDYTVARAAHLHNRTRNWFYTHLDKYPDLADRYTFVQETINSRVQARVYNAVAKPPKEGEPDDPAMLNVAMRWLERRVDLFKPKTAIELEMSTMTEERAKELLDEADDYEAESNRLSPEAGGEGVSDTAADAK